MIYYSIELNSSRALLVILELNTTASRLVCTEWSILVPVVTGVPKNRIVFRFRQQHLVGKHLVGRHLYGYVCCPHRTIFFNSCVSWSTIFLWQVMCVLIELLLLPLTSTSVRPAWLLVYLVDQPISLTPQIVFNFVLR